MKRVRMKVDVPWLLSQLGLPSDIVVRFVRPDPADPLRVCCEMYSERFADIPAGEEFPVVDPVVTVAQGEDGSRLYHWDFDA